MTVVIDKAHLTKLVHEMADTRPGSADHFGQRFLADLCYQWLGTSLLAKIGQQQKDPCETLLCRIEQLIDQVCFNAGIARQNMRDEHLREVRLVNKEPLDLPDVHSHGL